MSPAEFLHLLWDGKPNPSHILIWVRQGRKSCWFRDLHAAAQFVQQAGAQNDLYVGVGLSGRDLGAGHRCKAQDIVGLAGFWADFDLKSDAHTKPLPATIEDALSLVPDGLPSTIVIATGNGVHIWWLFNKPWIFANDQERKDAAALSFRFQTLLRYRSNQRGWAFDRLSDLARVLRIPGTTNAKDPDNPKQVDVYSIEGRRYDLSDFRDYLNNLPIPDADAEEHAAKKMAERFADQPFSVNLGAAIPDDVLAGWMQRDIRFRNTWERSRDDLHDQSQSGYDMALACFGVNDGLTDQQIVDLIVHHRRIHGEQQRKRVDYFQRTISKARKAEAQYLKSARFSAGEPPNNSSEKVDDPQAPGDEQVRKGSLCEQISRLLGVHMMRLLKVPGSDPIFFMELDEGRVEFDIKKLISQKSVRLALAAKTGKLIPTFKGRQWDQLAQMMLDACTLISGTDDLELEGNARIQISRYLSEVQFIAYVVEASKEDKFKPVVDEGKIAVSATDMQTYLNRVFSQNLSVKAVAMMCAAVGGEAIRHRPNAKVDQSRWALPQDKFDPKEYAPYLQDVAR
jgi:hypothetical protein